ncbi:MAG: hypothetical protein PVH88_12310 [Ignavibacteria bacterium]|jgi:hypothetical protein
MTKKENLFLLIKSLTKSEKRYFKLFVSMTGSQNNYIKLFDEIDNQTVYNEQKIKEDFKNEKFIKQLHVTKIYLSGLILKSLRNYHTSISKSAELKDTLRNIEILFQKELFNQCKYEIDKAIKTAIEYEEATSLIEILNWKRKIILASQNFFQGKKEILELLEIQNESLQKLTNSYSYWKYTFELFDHFNKGKKEFKKFLNSPLLKNLSDDELLQSKILYHHILFSSEVIQSNDDKALVHLDNLIELLESNPKRVKDDPSSLITALNNKVGILLNKKDYKNITPLIQKIRNLPEEFEIKNKSKISFKILMQTYNVELEMYRDTEDIEKGKKLISEVTEFINKNENILPADYKMLFHYQIAHIYFLAGEYSNSLKWLNEIIGGRFDNTREDIQSYSRFLNLIIHYELKNNYVLKYAVESCRRFLKKKRKLYNFENELLKFFAKLSMSLPEKHPVLFNKLKTKIFSETDEQIKQNALDYFNFEKWIDGKAGI